MNPSTGNTIYQFLQKSLEMLRKEFSELKTVTADQLMYVKEDLILPHHYSFYDFIVTKVSIQNLFNWGICQTLTSNFPNFRPEVRVGHFSHLTSTMIYDWSTTRVLKKKNLMPVKFCFEIGMKEINTYFQLAAGNLMILPRFTISTR